MKNINSAALQEGDIVRIPVTNGKVAIGKIIYVSNYFKDVIGVIIYTCTTRSEHLLNVNTLRSILCGPLYTSSVAAIKYGWSVIRRGPLSSDEEQLTLRIVAGHVYLKDKPIRNATREDEKKLKQMGVAGMQRVYREIEKADVIRKGCDE